MKTLIFEDQNGSRQVIEINLFPDRIVAKCNGTTAIFPVRRSPYELASEIYGLAYSGDDKRHRSKKVVEIAEWLADGDGGEGRSVIDLTSEWLAYDQEPEKENDNE